MEECIIVETLVGRFAPSERDHVYPCYVILSGQMKESWDAGITSKYWGAEGSFLRKLMLRDWYVREYPADCRMS